MKVGLNFAFRWPLLPATPNKSETVIDLRLMTMTQPPNPLQSSSSASFCHQMSHPTSMQCAIQDSTTSKNSYERLNVVLPWVRSRQGCTSSLDLSPISNSTCWKLRPPPLPHPVGMSAPSAGSEVAIDALSSVNYNLSGITSLGFTTSVGFKLWSFAP